MTNKLLDFHKNLEPEDYLNSYNFARKCDVVFAESISKNQFKKLNMSKDEYTIFEEGDEFLIYRRNKLKISEGDIIFCKTDFILELFSILRKNKKVNNISILTHQMANPPIEEKLFKLKPNCIKYWFSINVAYENTNLIPIPLGLGNKYATTNLQIEEIKEGVIENYKREKKNTVLVNFNPTTNKIREKIILYFKDLNWVTNEPIKEKKDFIEDLFMSKYSVCPIGWGLDTHRYWESLYFGVIPIVDNSYNYSKLLTPSEFQYLDISEVNLTNLEKKYDMLIKKLLDNLEKLTISWWFKHKIDLLQRNKNIREFLDYNFFDKVYKRFLKLRMRLNFG